MFSENTPVLDIFGAFKHLMRMLRIEPPTTPPVVVPYTDYLALIAQVRHQTTTIGLAFFGDSPLESLEVSGVLDKLATAVVSLSGVISHLLLQTTQSTQSTLQQDFSDLTKFLAQLVDIAETHYTALLSTVSQGASSPPHSPAASPSDDSNVDFHQRIGMVWKVCDDMAALPLNPLQALSLTNTTTLSRLKDAIKELDQLAAKRSSSSSSTSPKHPTTSPTSAGNGSIRHHGEAASADEEEDSEIESDDLDGFIDDLDDSSGSDADPEEQKNRQLNNDLLPKLTVYIRFTWKVLYNFSQFLSALESQNKQNNTHKSSSSSSSSSSHSTQTGPDEAHKNKVGVIPAPSDILPPVNSLDTAIASLSPLVDRLCEALYFDENTVPIIHSLTNSLSRTLDSISALHTTLPHDSSVTSLPWLPVVGSLQQTLTSELTTIIKCSGSSSSISDKT